MASLDPQTKTDPASQPDTLDVFEDDALSPPLYVSALIATLAALASINSVLGVDELAVTSFALSIFGFAFSFACRWYRVPPKLLNFLAFFVAGYLIFRVVSGAISISALVPVSQNQGDLQMAVILEWLAVIYSWTLVDDRKVVGSSILSIAMIGLVAAYDVNVDLVLFFLVYVVSTIFLLIHQNYLLHRTWGRQDQDSGESEWRLLNTQLVMSAACGLVALLAGMLLVVPLRAVGSHLSLATALRGLVDFGAHGADSPASTDNFFDDPSFSIGTGSGFSASEETVMRVYPSDQQEHYWRGRTYDKYMQSGWISTQASSQVPLQPTVLSDGPYAEEFRIPSSQIDAPLHQMIAPLSTTVDVLGGSTNTIYSPQYPIQINVSKTLHSQLVQCADGQIGLDHPASAFTYKVFSLQERDDLQGMRHASVRRISPQIRSLYITQPDPDLSPDDAQQLAETAEDIVSDLPPSQQNEFDRAEAIRKWVSQRAIYSLDVSAVPPGKDPVSYFLFTSRRGYCDLYASSMALLCRFDGIPTRVVTGFAPSVRRSDGGFDVRLKDKHAWCEVYFAGYGWYTFDPTSGVQVDSDKKVDAQRGNIVAAFLARLRNFLILNGPLPVILVAIVILCAAYVIKVEIVDRFFPSKRSRKRLQGSAAPDDAGSPDEHAIAQARLAVSERWADTLSILAHWRLVQQPYETTREFVSRCGQVFAQAESATDGQGAKAAPMPATVLEAAEALERIAEGHLEVRYASEDDRLAHLVQSERDGSAERDYQTVESFVNWGRRYARRTKAAVADREKVGV